jgi:hypothetical protein
MPTALRGTPQSKPRFKAMTVTQLLKRLERWKTRAPKGNKVEVSMDSIEILGPLREDHSREVLAEIKLEPED